MTKSSNVSPISLAVAEIRKGEKASASGASMLTLALAQAMDHRLYYTLGEEPHAFTLLEYREPFLNDDGTKSGKHQSARLTAIMVDLLGETEGSISNAVKTAFNKCYSAAVLIRLSPTFNVIKVKNGNLINVPLSYAIDLDSAPVQKKVLQGIQTAAQLSGKELTDAEALTEAYGLKVETSGGAHPLFGKLPSSPQMIATLGEVAQKMGYVPAKEARAPRAAATAEDEGQSMIKAFAFLTEKMSEQVGGDEASVAFTKEMDVAAFSLWSLLSKYLDAADLI
jgi:hypothetical protein